jgi:hypothetical protein
MNPSDELPGIHHDDVVNTINPELDDIPPSSYLVDVNGATVVLKEHDRRVAISRALERLPDEIVYAGEILSVTCTRIETQHQ